MLCSYSLLTISSIVFSIWRFFFFKQKTAYDMRISDWSSDVCSSDLLPDFADRPEQGRRTMPRQKAVEQPDTLDTGRQLRGEVTEDQIGKTGVAFDDAIDFSDRLATLAQLHGAELKRSEERRVGKEWVSTGRSRWSP